jgi:protein tyrosine/serine phosphatase
MTIKPPNPLRMALLTFLAAIFLAACASAQTVQTGSDSSADRFLTNIRIKNFGKMDDRFYRGAQPREDDYRDLAALGIKTVIDLKNDPAPYEKRNVEALGMRYINIPMSDKTYPRQEQIEQFLKIVNDPATGKFFVHCEGGRHRTGVMGAVYRFNFYHWNYDQVYREMKDYDFYTRFGHGEMKRFVEDYWQRLQTSSNGAAAVQGGR